MLYKRSEQSRAVPEEKRPPFRTWTSLRAEGPAPALSPAPVFPTPSLFFPGIYIRREGDEDQ